MLYSVVQISRNKTAFFSHIGLSPAGSVVVIDRTGLAYDGRYAPVSQSESRTRSVFFFVLAGSFQPSSESAPSQGPCAWFLSEDDIEGALGRRNHTIRTWGNPHIAVTIHVKNEDSLLTLAPGEAPRRLELPPEVLAAARHHADCVRNCTEQDDWDRSARALIATVAAVRWLKYEASRWNDSPLAAGAGRIWRALSTFYTRMELSPSVVQFADLAHLSARHVDRLLRRWIDDYGLPLEGWRHLTRRWRLKAAVLLLSSRDYRVGEVAKLVGYSNSEALTNALAAEGLPSPVQYRTLFEDLT